MKYALTPFSTHAVPSTTASSSVVTLLPSVTSSPTPSVTTGIENMQYCRSLNLLHCLEPQNLPLIIGVAVASAVLAVVIVVLLITLVVICCCYAARNSNSKESKQYYANSVA